MGAAMPFINLPILGADYRMEGKTGKIGVTKSGSDHNKLSQNRGQITINSNIRDNCVLTPVFAGFAVLMSNYTNHIANTPVDTAFKKFSWEKPATAKVA